VLFRSKNKIAATLAVYRLRVKNIAVNANDPSNPDLYTQRGLDEAYGIEGEANGTVLPQLSLSVSYAWNVARIKESAVPEDINAIKENAPRFSGSSWLKYTFGKGKLKGLSFSAGHVHQTTRNTLTRGFTLPEYITLQAGMGYTWLNTRLSFNVNNLLNKRYWVGGYNYASIWPGAPRSLLVNVEYFFK
jgi:iron complex outermembrane receptor protein